MNLRIPTRTTHLPRLGAQILPPQPRPVGNVRSTNEGDPIDVARKRFLDEGELQHLNGDLTADEHQLIKAVVNPDKPGAPFVSVSTFAVDGAQSQDMMVIKRVPVTEGMTNFIVYMPEDEVMSFHTFETAEEMTEWVRNMAQDPAELDRLAGHFSHPEAPGQEERVREQLKEFGKDNQSSVAVGSFGRERDDIFARLNRDVTVPPVEVNGLFNTRLFNLASDGKATYVGTREDGEHVVYDYDAYGNFRGGSEDGYYFVKDGLNSKEPLGDPSSESPEEFAKQHVARQALEKAGPNDLSDFWAYLVKQLRNPGHGIGTALKQFGVPDDIANSIEEIVKNPVTGTLLELNHDNRLGNVFGVEKEMMDQHLENFGNEVQSNIPRYGTARENLNTLADVIESVVGTSEEFTTQVMT
ncbi:dermonecrotic toxin domain-containing protein [Pseudomonas khavaziana]|uniref:dermonecrotic toxin domain-containing protein n=1 Tax=Pseudomonas khavaziana TaxID=2842351 RepID=UPI001CEC7B5B|nr:DUF6543 domain-containing protein [Pseudomonas khavaziana]